MEGLEAEKVDEYSVALGKLFRWLKLAIQIRKEDIIARKEKNDQKRAFRQEKIEQEEERRRVRETEFEAA